MRPFIFYAGALATLAMLSGGCLVDDDSAGRGQATTPAATVPDSGSPVRRESAAKTLNDAEPDRPTDASGDLSVEPAPGRVPPPPVQ